MLSSSFQNSNGCITTITLVAASRRGRAKTRPRDIHVLWAWQHRQASGSLLTSFQPSRLHSQYIPTKCCNIATSLNLVSCYYFIHTPKIYRTLSRSEVNWPETLRTKLNMVKSRRGPCMLVRDEQPTWYMLWLVRGGSWWVPRPFAMRWSISYTAVAWNIHRNLSTVSILNPLLLIDLILVLETTLARRQLISK